MPPENNQNFNQSMPQQLQKSGSGLNTILLILLIALVGFGIWYLSQKKEDVVVKEVPVDTQAQTEDENSNETNNQPQVQNSNIEYSIPNQFSFSHDNSANVTIASNPKGSYYVSKSTDTSNDSNLEVITFVSQMGQGFDPAMDPDSRFLENQTYGNNKYDVYVMSYGEASGNIYFLQNFDTNEAIIITSYHDQNVPMTIDLASVKFN